MSHYDTLKFTLNIILSLVRKISHRRQNCHMYTFLLLIISWVHHSVHYTKLYLGV